ncbi:ATP-dependent RNA helicase HrpA [Mobiluncus mulieris]|uniref:ATP-dependent RNA helicase HrpA n=1 Tax=Mobiluncus mulieris TaxID=2052 RepID=UPI00147068D7|nr:ATP-dependent RNA helicase HrpA [Mobiluncus mulieris]NMW74330.1 ATP-dependent RNA helicase HrpA [Mobiluncus mulieris]
MPRKLTYPPELPVTEARAEILDAMRHHQVIVISGATGSGKTTQLPKMCLEVGRGTNGIIGHTQPRRLAARTVATRIAAEMDETLGQTVGYQVRFRQNVGADTRIKLMTDGILLSEMSQDPQLRRYDTLIIDEAHERSLNIDFILGYLQRLVKIRPDLLVIITSATIDSQRFATAFGVDTPVIEVAGRTFPVEIRYRPLVTEVSPGHLESCAIEPSLNPEKSLEIKETEVDVVDQEIDQVTGILRAVDELVEAGPGDILVFLAGEADIRDTAAALKGHLGHRFVEPDSKSNVPGAIEVLPLYSRLSEAAQQSIFAPHSLRRIVLATNVAETSLTVPGIVYVIDPGVARISRYSNKTRVQRLPIEPISQASANQRAGRCGRTCPGICIRLYSQQDFLSRPEYTEPEIQRTSLSAVILQMASLGLGEVADFPFLDPPSPRSVTDGVLELSQLGALDTRKKPVRITRLGRKIARLPLDPRLARILLAADELGVASEAVIVVAALAMQDVRERPSEKRSEADEMHARFEDERSDFLAYLRLWSYLQRQKGSLSGSAFRRRCSREFLHYLRVREWFDLAKQLREMLQEIGINTRSLNEINVDVVDANALHQALLYGMLAQIGYWSSQKREYLGARGQKFVVWPGSGLTSKHYDWVMAAELVETSRLFARTVARVEPEWIEQAGKYLLVRSYFEPYWSLRAQAAMIHERVTLYGLTLVADRAHTLASLGSTLVENQPARDLARALFIRHALVAGEWRENPAFIQTNQERLVAAQEARVRLQIPGEIDDFTLESWFDKKLPENVTSAAAFNAWWKTKRFEDPQYLDFPWELLVPASEDAQQFPDFWNQNETLLPLAYTFGGKRGGITTAPTADIHRNTTQSKRHKSSKIPQREIDVVDLSEGVTIIIPERSLETIDPTGFDWPIPGALREHLLARIKALPKQVRKKVVPAAALVEEIWEPISAYLGVNPSERPSLDQVFSQAIATARRVELSRGDLSAMHEALPENQRNHFAIITAKGRVLAKGDDFSVLRNTLIVNTTTHQGKVWHQQEAEKAKVEKPRDYAAALTEALELPQTRVITRWRGAEAAALAASPYPSTAALVQAAQSAAGVALTQEWLATGHQLEGEDDLVQLQAECANRFEDTVYRILQGVAATMHQRVELQRVIENARAKASPTLHHTIQEIVNHVNQLLEGDFLARTPYKWLQRLEKYLQADTLRLEKARHNSAADAELSQRLAEVMRDFETSVATIKARPFHADTHRKIQEIYWLLEEFRLSLFAQQLGTIEKVSAKRLRKLLAEIL